MNQGRSANLLLMLCLFVAGFIGFLILSGYGQELIPMWWNRSFSFAGGRYDAQEILWVVVGMFTVGAVFAYIATQVRLRRATRIVGSRITLRDLDLPEPQSISALPAFRDTLKAAIGARTPSAPYVVNQILRSGIALGASDVHLTPDHGQTRVTLRVHGALYELCHLTSDFYGAVVNRFKVLSNLEIFVRNRPQDGRLDMGRTGYGARVSVLPTNHGEKIVLRLATHDPSQYDLSGLGMTTDILETLKAVLNRNQGLVVLTGPTGSGKTTTMYGSLLHINDSRGHDTNIVTLEDPIEFDFAAFSQTQIAPDKGLTFANGLRSLLRQDPDVILVGEIRDDETADICMRAATTGHLLLTTVHADCSASVFARMAQMGANPMQLASATAGVLSQRLCKKLCPHCQREHEVTGAQTRQFQLLGFELPPDGPFYTAAGCNECLDTGYNGRLSVYELLVVSASLRDLIAAGEPTHLLRQHAQEQSMKTLLDDGLAKCRAGLITLDEVLRVCTA